jgi:hypothetical protein
VLSLDNACERKYVGAFATRGGDVGNGTDEGKSTEALAIVIKALKDPIKRKQFADDPNGQLEDILGTDQLKNLKPGVKQFLSGLTYEELRVLSQLENTLEAAQMTVQAGGHTIGKL